MSGLHPAPITRQLADGHQLISPVFQLRDQHGGRIRRRLIKIMHQDNIPVLYIGKDRVDGFLRISRLPVKGIDGPENRGGSSFCQRRLGSVVDISSRRTDDHRSYSGNRLQRIIHLVQVGKDLPLRQLRQIGVIPGMAGRLAA